MSTKKRYEKARLNQLKFYKLKKNMKSLKIHGRTKERKLLQESLERIIMINPKNQTKTANPVADVDTDTTAANNNNNNNNNNNTMENEPMQQQQASNRSLVFINGQSGTGKSALALSLRDYLVMIKTRRKGRGGGGLGGLFVTGKFDLYLRDEPYLGIATACRQICGEILLLRNNNNNNRSFQEIHDTLLEKLGTEHLYLLTKVIPELTEIITTTTSETTTAKATTTTTTTTTEDDFSSEHGQTESSTNTNTATTKAKFHHLFRIFMRVITSYFGPLVVVLDDLQWSDMSSLELIEVIMTDRSNSQLMMIGLYRSNEVDKEHMLTKLIANLKERSCCCHHLITGDDDDDDDYQTGTGDSSNGDDDGLITSEITVGNLDLETTKAVTMDLLSIDDDTDDIQELSEICYQRTLGNVFFLVQYIVTLEEDGYIEFDYINTHKYKWDISKIKNETDASSNVVELMQRKMMKLSSSTTKTTKNNNRVDDNGDNGTDNDFGRLLSLASCLGSSFDKHKLEIVWNEVVVTGQGGGDQEASSISNMLEITVQEGLLERKEGELEVDEGNNRHYRWVHDRVQEAACALIPPEERNEFKFRVGDILCQKLTPEELDSSIFVVVNLINEITTDNGDCFVLDNSKRVRLAELNLQATRKAMSFSALYSASKYSTKGIELLPTDDCWEKYYQLALELYSCSAEAEDSIGDDDSMKRHCNEVLKQDISICPLKDKLRVYNVLALYTANSGKHVDAVTLLMQVLGDLGVKFPKFTISRLFATLSGLLKVKSKLLSLAAKQQQQQQSKNCTATSTSTNSLPLMTDQNQIEVMKLLDNLATFAYLAGSDLCALAILKSVNKTFKYGLCEYSPPALASIAMIVTGVLQDPKGGTQIGEYSLSLLDKLSTRNPISRTKFIVCTFVLPWTKPFRNVSYLLFESYEDGMRVGDTESSMYGIFVYIMQSAIAGRSLKLTVGDCSIYSEQMKELKRQQALDYTKVIWQTAQNLMGQSENTTVLQGDCIDDEENFLTVRLDNKPMVAIIRTQQMRLCLVFGEHEKCSNLFISYGYDWPEAAPGHVMFMEAIFCGGLSSFDMARKAGKSRTAKTRNNTRKYKMYAMKARATVKVWIRHQNPNVRHYEAVMDAEQAVLDCNHNIASQKYQAAVAMAARGGYIHDAAIISERYGEYVLSVLDDKDSAAFHFDTSIKFYSEWNANKKVELLRDKYSYLWTAPSEIIPSAIFSVGSSCVAEQSKCISMEL